MDISRHYIARKVPEITLLFWVVKLLTTAMGEASSDYLVNRYNPFIAVILAGLILLVGLYFQFKSIRYRPFVYWFSVSMVAVFGTMAADGLHIKLGVPYIISSIFFAAVLIFVFFVWNRTEHNLSIHSINTFRREIFYWSIVLITFALGTALGDLTASSFGLGYLDSGILFLVLFMIPLLGQKYVKAREVLTFWSAYILTRPLGASFADWFSKPKAIKGLGYGEARVALILIAVIVIYVSFMTLSKRELKRENP